jgi:hypothetical protein
VRGDKDVASIMQLTPRAGELPDVRASLVCPYQRLPQRPHLPAPIRSTVPAGTARPGSCRLTQVATLALALGRLGCVDVNIGLDPLDEAAQVEFESNV